MSRTNVDDTTLDEALVGLVQRYPDGFDVERARALLPAPYRASKTRVEERLRKLAAQGLIHRWGKRIAPESYVARAVPCVLQALANSPKTFAQIERALPETMRMRGWPRRALLEALQRGLIFEHPDPKGKRVSRYARTAADPKLYISQVERALETTLKRLGKSGIDRAALLVALGGVRDPATPVAAEVLPGPTVAPPEPKPSADEPLLRASGDS